MNFLGEAGQNHMSSERIQLDLVRTLEAPDVVHVDDAVADA
jgi:hypothetical protein